MRYFFTFGDIVNSKHLEADILFFVDIYFVYRRIKGTG